MSAVAKRDREYSFGERRTTPARARTARSGAPMRGLATAAALFSPRGCVAGAPVNEHGLGVRVPTAENATSRAVYLDAWGFHVTTLPCDAGFALGKTSRAYF